MAKTTLLRLEGSGRRVTPQFVNVQAFTKAGIISEADNDEREPGMFDGAVQFGYKR